MKALLILKCKKIQKRLHYIRRAWKLTKRWVVFKRSTLWADCVSTASPGEKTANLKVNVLNIRFILIIGLRLDTECLPLCYHPACLSSRSLTPPNQTPEDLSRLRKKWNKLPNSRRLRGRTELPLQSYVWMTKRWCRRRYRRLTLHHVPVDSTWRALVRFIIAGVAQADIPLDLYENLDKSCNRNAFVPAALH